MRIHASTHRLEYLDWVRGLGAVIMLNGHVWHSYLAPGLGLAGGNLERDLATVLRFSEEYGTEAGVIASFVANSAHRKDWVLRTLHQAVLATSPGGCKRSKNVSPTSKRSSKHVRNFEFAFAVLADAHVGRPPTATS